MPYRTRPRYQAKVQPRETARKSPPKKKVVVPAGRWEPGIVLSALNEMHNGRQEAK